MIQPTLRQVLQLSPVLAAAITPDMTTVVVYTGQGDIKRRDLASGSLLTTTQVGLPGAKDRYALSDDGRIFALGQRQILVPKKARHIPHITLWDLEANRRVGELRWKPLMIRRSD